MTWTGRQKKVDQKEEECCILYVCMYVYSMAFYLTGWLVAAGIHHDQMVPILGASSSLATETPLLKTLLPPPNLQTPILQTLFFSLSLFLPAWTAAIQIDEGAVQHARPTAKKDHILWIHWRRMRGWSQLASSFSLFSSFLFIFFPTSYRQDARSNSLDD